MPRRPASIIRPLLPPAAVVLALALAGIWTVSALRAHLHGGSGIMSELVREAARLLAVAPGLCGAALVVAAVAILRANHRRSERLRRELRCSREQVYIEQARAQVILESVSDAVISMDPDRRVTYMNPAAEALTGWSLEGARGRDVGELIRLAGTGSAGVLTDFERVIAGESLSGEANGVLLRRADGSDTPVHERAAPIRDRRGVVIGIVLALRDVTREREFAQQLTYQATHDALTGLTNRAHFEVRLGAALEEFRHTHLSHVLLYLDLDQFKVVNDTCGHAGGDELIKQVAWVMRSRMRDGDVLARLGGDEFGMLLPQCSEQDGLAFAERIRNEIAEARFRWEDRLFGVHASIGVLALGDELTTVGEVLAAADHACYVAKDNGRNRVQLYRPDDEQVQSRRGEMRWVERIGAALDDGRFVLVAQEVRALSTRARRRGGRRFELLLRMVDPDGRLVAPMGFIPAAERYGLMPRIDRWVIARACCGLAALKQRGGELPTCMINLSGTSVSDPSLAEYIAGCLRENGLTGANVGFELTETAAIGNIVSASELMAQLRCLGCLIALDDFGSGMASFAYLKSLPIDLLKVDGSFIRDVRVDLVNLAMVEAVQRIGDVMGLQTVAEGVDSEGILATLAAIGVDHAQGFHIGQPVPLEQMLDPPAPLLTPRSGALALAGA